MSNQSLTPCFITSSSRNNNSPFMAIQSFLANCETPIVSHSSPNSKKRTYTIQQEIGFYISSIDKDTQFENFWKTNELMLPKLASLVRCYCMMPITSVASESAFSIAGYVQRKHRSSISPTTLRYLMLLRDYEWSI